VAVLVALALAGVASATIHPPGVPAASPALAAGVQGLAGSHATAWFCAGPLPVGTPHEASSITIANRGTVPATAAVTVVLASGAPSTEQVSLPAEHESVVAARVVVDSTSVVVAEAVQGATGPEASPCTGQATATQYLVAGSTQAGNNLAIALYDPGSTPAVADLSFATPLGPQSPPALQGVQVAAGHVVVLHVNRSLPFRRFLSATVRALGGAIVAGALDTVVSGGVAFESLEGPVVLPVTQWYFGSAPAGATAQQTFDLFNPGRRPADVEIRLGGPSGVGEITLALAPGATTRYSPAPDQSAAALRWASVTSMNEVPVVAARELLVAAPLHVPAPSAKSAAARQRRARDLLPTLPVGFTITPGAAVLAKDWTIPGGQSDARVSEIVTVANPSARNATVRIRALVGSLPGLGPLTVGPKGSIVVDLADLPAATGRLVLRVTADVAVVASAELYDRGARGSPGLAAPAAFPLG
jgi:hypothetical protein